MDDSTLLSWIEKGQNIAALLVAVGVAAEFALGFMAGPARRRIDQAKDAEVIRLTNVSATLNKEAEQLRKDAEDERLARVKLEKQIQPITLNEPDRKAIGDELRQFAPSFKGRKVKISSPSGEAESMAFSLEIMDILNRAGIEVDTSGMGRIISSGAVDMGVMVTGPPSDEKFIRLLSTSIAHHADTGTRGEWDAKYTETGGFVGVKPVVGLEQWTHQ